MGLHGGRPSLEMNNSPSREFLSSFLIALYFHLLGHRPDHLFHRYRFHTPKIEWAFSQEARTAFHVMPQYRVPNADRTR